LAAQSELAVAASAVFAAPVHDEAAAADAPVHLAAQAAFASAWTAVVEAVAAEALEQLFSQANAMEATSTGTARARPTIGRIRFLRMEGVSWWVSECRVRSCYAIGERP
jgi:hypothetical protein